MTNISSNINLPSGAPYSSTPSQTYTPAIPRDDYEVLTPGTHPVPQGASKVLIRNSGIVDITVNGKPVEPGGQHPFETWGLLSPQMGKRGFMKNDLDKKIMKKGIYILLFVFINLNIAFGQGYPTRDFEGIPYCEDLGAGATRQLFSVMLFEVGELGGIQHFYTDSLGTQVTPTGSLSVGFCNQSIGSQELPLDTVQYDSYIHLFNNYDTVATLIPSFSGITEFREAVVYNFTNAVLIVRYNIEGLALVQPIMIPPGGVFVSPNVSNEDYNHTKFTGLQIEGLRVCNNVGFREPKPMIIVNVKEYR